MMRRIRSCGFVLACAALLACAAARATSLRQMTLAEMTRAAQVIVRAKCVEQSSSWEGGEIWTFTTFEAQEIWKGPAPPRIVVRLLGGRTPEFTSTVAGVPRFRAGEEVVLFLEPTNRGDFSIVSWMQGTFRIVRGAGTGEERVVQDTAAFAVFNPATRRFESNGVRFLPIAELRAKVAAALSASGGGSR